MNPIAKNDFSGQYVKIWEAFANDISGLTRNLMEYAGHAEEGSLHQVLHSLQSVPYYQAPAMFDAFGKAGTDNFSTETTNVKVDRNNIGSVTGVFFELMAASLVTGYVKERLPEAKIELNSSGILREYLKGSRIRDADILVSYRDRYVVFETKVSPKKNDINNAVYLRNTYEGLPNHKVCFLLVGGHVSVDKPWIECTQGWACYTSGSDENKALLKSYKLDTILAKAVEFLR